MVTMPTEVPTRARCLPLPNSHRRHHTHPNQHLHGCSTVKHLLPLSPQIATLLSLIRSPAREAPPKGSRPFLHSVISLLRPRIPVKPVSRVLLLFPFLVLVDSGSNRGTGVMLPRTSWPTLEKDILLNLPHKSNPLLPNKVLRLHKRGTICVLLGQ